MAWEWVAPTATGVVALAGIASTFAVSRGTWRVTEKVALDQRVHQRRADAYVEMLQYAEKVGAWVAHVLPVVDVGQEQPSPPPLDDQLRVAAVMAAHASATVGAAYDDWMEKVLDITRSVRKVTYSQGPNTNSDVYGRGLDEWDHLDSILRAEERVLRKRLQDHAAHDLGHRPFSTWRDALKPAAGELR